jgi:predicted ATPase
LRLSAVSVEGYRSLRQRLSLNLDDQITVVLGANDHGKTNLLHAMRHLNPDVGYDAERDLNWDYGSRGTEFPSIHFTLKLNEEERGLLGEERVRRHLLEKAANFRAQLRAEAEAADAERLAAQGAFEGAQSTSSGDASEGEAVVDGAKAASGDLAKARDQAITLAEQAHRRAALAHAEELRLMAQIKGEPTPDLSELAQKAQEEAASAAKAATRAKSKAQAAASRGDADAKGVEAASATALEDATRLAEESQALGAAADAAVLAENGELSFAPDGAFPRVADPGVQDVARTIVLSRIGVSGKLELADPLPLYADMTMRFVLERLPRVELFQTQEAIPDAATPETINDAQNDFMRGIFWYAGLGPAEWPGIFTQSDATSKRLDDASEALNETLKATWSQGGDLDFQLRHNHGEIDLLIRDPAVKVRKVRASRRSSGFTHFFALQTMLYARQRARTASSYLWLFDEPGVYLHPGGQHDLLQVLETLAESDQLVYATHSIFMINKNYPTRHRLLIKDGGGTRIDQKPYSGRWRNAIDALGMSLPGSFLFASKVLLVEGDSDPIYLNADVRKLIELGDLDVDLNPFAAISTGEAQNAAALIRLMQESTPVPTIALLFDGDKGGANRAKGLAKLVESLKLQTKSLDNETVLEDHLLSPELYCESVVEYAEALGAAKDVADKIRASFAARSTTEKPVDLAKWARTEAWALTGLDEDPSPVGLARHYLDLIADASADVIQGDKAARQRSLALAKWIADNLGLRSQTVQERRILLEETAALGEVPSAPAKIAAPPSGATRKKRRPTSRPKESRAG